MILTAHAAHDLEGSGVLEDTGSFQMSLLLTANSARKQNSRPMRYAPCNSRLDVIK